MIIVTYQTYMMNLANTPSARLDTMIGHASFGDRFSLISTFHGACESVAHACLATNAVVRGIKIARLILVSKTNIDEALSTLGV